MNKRKEKRNKAGYTANTSCARVGRGGNARFNTFQLVHHDRRTDWRMDKATYRVAYPQLKEEDEVEEEEQQQEKENEE